MIFHADRFLDVPIPMAQGLGLYIQMFLSYGLHVCIILENAYHRTTFEIFCNITQKTTPEENSCKIFHISSLVVLFSYGKVKDIFGISIIFNLKRAKGMVREGYGGEGKNEVLFFVAKFPLLIKIQTLSHKLLVRQTSNHHHCNQHAQKHKCQDFQSFSAVLPGQKQICVFLGTNMATK